MVTMATQNPWYGYKRIAVMCRRAGQAVKDCEAYIAMCAHRLLQRPRERVACRTDRLKMTPRKAPSVQ